MSKADLKIKINKAIEEVPEDVLVEVLDYLNQARKASPAKLNLSKNFGKILREDKGLLKKLAL